MYVILVRFFCHCNAMHFILLDVKSNFYWGSEWKFDVWHLWYVICSERGSVKRWEWIRTSLVLDIRKVAALMLCQINSNLSGLQQGNLLEGSIFMGVFYGEWCCGVVLLSRKLSSSVLACCCHHGEAIKPCMLNKWWPRVLGWAVLYSE